MSVAEPGPLFPVTPGRVGPAVRRDTSRLAAGATRSRVNAVFGVLLVLVVAITPLPLGSNRPALWAFWAIAIGLLAAAYGMSVLLLRAPVRQSVAACWPELGGMLVVLVWLAIQLAPLGISPPPLAVAAGHATISLDPGSTRLSLMTFAIYGMLFVLVSQVAVNRRRARRMLLALFLIVAALAAYGLVSLTQLGDTLLGFEKRYYFGSATGTFINRNSFATFLASGLAIGVPLLADGATRQRGTRLARMALVVLGLLFIAAALFATRSRMGAVAGVAGALVALAFVMPRRKWLWTGLVALVVLGILAVIAVSFGAATIERMIFTSDEAGRGELYPQVWEAILQRPWLGYGGGSFGTVFPMFQHAPLSSDGLWDRAHSTYLSLWFEMGMIVGTVPLLIVATLVARAALGLRDSSSRTLSVAAIGVTVVFSIHSLVDFSAEIMANAFLFTTILALAAPGGRREHGG